MAVRRRMPMRRRNAARRSVRRSRAAPRRALRRTRVRRVALKRARKQHKRPKFNPSELGNIKTYIQQIADFVTVSPPANSNPTTPDLVGTQCVYMSQGISNNNSTLYPLMGIPDLTAIAHDVYQTDPENVGNVPLTLPCTKFRILGCNSKYKFINQSNSQVNVDLFYCKSRRDIPNSWSMADLHAVLGDGFYQRGYGSTRGSGNEGSSLASLTPYDSSKYTSLFDIYKTEKCIVNCGCTITRVIKHGMRYINWEHYETPQAPGSQPSQIYSHMKGEKFILFKITPNPAVAVGPSGQILNTYSEPLCQLQTINHYNYQGVNSQQPKIYKAPAIGYNGYNNGSDDSAPFLAQNQDGHIQRDTFAGSNLNGGQPYGTPGTTYNSTIAQNQP